MYKFANYGVFYAVWSKQKLILNQPTENPYNYKSQEPIKLGLFTKAGFTSRNPKCNKAQKTHLVGFFKKTFATLIRTVILSLTPLVLCFLKQTSLIAFDLCYLSWFLQTMQLLLVTKENQCRSLGQESQQHLRKRIQSLRSPLLPVKVWM